ncbi:MAG: zf-HC2 domain-containing protein [Armatimonadetes bacterium]|nr:zf-HC2 domain-containing protein [Armatimonadota bacterium]
MICKSAKILVSALLDGELSPRERSALDRHLASCASCSEEMEKLAKVREIMSGWGDEEPSPWLAANFTEKLARLQQEKTASKSGRLTGWVFGTAVTGAAVTLVLVGFFAHGLIQQGFTPPRYESPPRISQRDDAPVATHEGTIRQQEIRRATNEHESQPRNQQTAQSNREVSGGTRHHPGTSYPVGTSSDYSGARDRGLPIKRDNKGLQLANELIAVAQAQEVGATILGAGVTQTTAAVEVTENLSEIQLAMNETVERVRGSIMEAVDTVVQASNAADSRVTDNYGGTTL